ncbi:50S ribosomal protein L24 [Aspergillus japonicus CBS 114.51]|uniref:Large ribosomal subunit protein bL28m n=2 Tax=Aspergillus TaxID=5052 RepID=A0A2V5HIW9_ASPV1|nr:50S ribosomal protein L24 [Aspergillus japonicus CBS 114.51]PYI22512.1 50S ribosomal protein L24 [Aspergillus violaceofuscus CBS 115571]RAH85703.1 50S ribosomal protein L24 [Aspergillus japonicus CBS 114.51]
MAGLQTRSAMSLPFTLSAAFRNLSLNTAKRSFSTTLPVQKTRQLPDHIPPYPYGPNYVFKQSNSGLYGGAMIRFGNKISDGKNEGKTRRSWKPNVRRKKIWSESLEKFLFIKVTKKALRTIEKCGGLDNYLLGNSPARIKELGIFGWELRWQVMNSPKMQEKFEMDRLLFNIEKPQTFEEFVAQKEAERKKAALDLTNIKKLTKPTLNEKQY